MECPYRESLEEFQRIIGRGVWSAASPRTRVESRFIVQSLSVFLLRIPTDTIPPTFDETAGVLRNHFFSCKWNEVYDFVDFTIRQLTAPPPEGLTGNMVTDFNSVLERENSGYRIINGIVTEITSGAEISEIEQAISSPLTGVKTHLETGLGL